MIKIGDFSSELFSDGTISGFKIRVNWRLTKFKGKNII